MRIIIIIYNNSIWLNVFELIEKEIMKILYICSIKLKERKADGYFSWWKKEKSEELIEF